MIRFNCFELLKDSLLRSVRAFQYERSGYPFVPDDQNALFTDNYGAVENFLNEFKECLFNNLDRKENLKPYITEIYYKIAFYGHLYRSLFEEYELRLFRNTGEITFDSDRWPKTSYYKIEDAFASICSVLSSIRSNARSYEIVDLLPLEEMEDSNFTLLGTYNLSTIASQPLINIVDESNKKPILNKRGVYTGSQIKKENAIDYYKTELRIAIRREYLDNKKPDQRVVHDYVWAKLLNRNIKDRTLRGYLPSDFRIKIFGEICQEILTTLKLRTK